MTEAKKKTRMRRSPRGDVRRGPSGEIQMITLKAYRDNPLAPTAYVSEVGGIYRDHNLVRVTFIDEVPNSEGVLETIAQSHLVWKSERNWLDSGEVFRWIMSEFNRGLFRRERDGARAQ